MKEYEVGDKITIRKDVDENNINEIMKPVFGDNGDDYKSYLHMLIDRKFLGKTFTIMEKKRWRFGEYAYRPNWGAVHYTSPKMFKRSEKQLFLFEDEI